MAGKEMAVKKCVVNLNAEERERLEILLHAGKSPAQLLTRACILLKADVSIGNSQPKTPESNSRGSTPNLNDSDD